MNRSEIECYREMLEAKKSELSLGRRSREEITIEKMADAMDEVQSASERELAISNLDRESKLLQSISSTLSRITDGSFGVCLHCDTEISPRRLRAVPWTAYCLRCQEEFDRREFESDTTSRPDQLVAA